MEIPLHAAVRPVSKTKKKMSEENLLCTQKMHSEPNKSEADELQTG